MRSVRTAKCPYSVEKDDPQPQVDLAFGFLIVNPPPVIVSTKSTSAFFRYLMLIGWDRRVAMTASWFTEDSMAQKNTAEVDRAYKLRHLHELIAALDRRVPRIESAGEVSIARDAAVLRKKALQRIAMLERKSGDNPT
jgi:hypothetical protein